MDHRNTADSAASQEQDYGPHLTRGDCFLLQQKATVRKENGESVRIPKGTRVKVHDISKDTVEFISFTLQEGEAQNRSRYIEQNGEAVRMPRAQMAALFGRPIGFILGERFFPPEEEGQGGEETGGNQ